LSNTAFANQVSGPWPTTAYNFHTRAEPMTGRVGLGRTGVGDAESQPSVRAYAGATLDGRAPRRLSLIAVKSDPGHAAATPP
jgi:hypothetical protein